MGISILGFILGVLVVIFGIFRNWNFVFMTIIGAVVVALMSGMPFFETMLTGDKSYSHGLGGFVTSYFVLFLLSSIFANYMDKSGAAASIGRWVVSIIGADKPFLILVSVFIIGAILSIGGISTFVVVFVVIPIARSLFKEMDIPWHLVMTPFYLGIGTWTVSCFPGSAQVQNVIAAEGLGTPLTSAPIPSICATVAFIVWGLWRMWIEWKQVEGTGMGFDPKYDHGIDPNNATERQLPPVWASFLPLVVLLGTIMIGSAVGLDQNIYYGMAGAAIISAILSHKYVESHQSVIADSISNSITTTIIPGAAVGFGNVIASAPGLQSIIGGAQSLPIPPILSLSIITLLISLAIGTASGTIALVSNSLIKLFDLTGVNPELVHRLIVIPAVTYAPQNNSVLIFYEVTGLDHASSYKNFSIMAHGGLLIAFIVAYGVSLLVY